MFRAEFIVWVHMLSFDSTDISSKSLNQTETVCVGLEGLNSFAWIGPRPRVYITDGTLMREVLTKHQNFQKNFRTTNKVYKLLVGGIVEFEEEKWSRHRGKLNPAFHLDRLKVTII